MLGERPAHLWPVCIKPTTRSVSPNRIVTVLVRGPHPNTVLFQSADYTSRKTRVGSNHAFTYQEGSTRSWSEKHLLVTSFAPTVRRNEIQLPGGDLGHLRPIHTHTHIHTGMRETPIHDQQLSRYGGRTQPPDFMVSSEASTSHHSINQSLFIEGMPMCRMQ